jgi:protocatechuate 3,4-dioxygenase beta subunit
MQRRNFLKISGLTTLSTGLVHAFLYGGNTALAPEEARLSLLCEPTTADILGPYYRTNSPLRSDIVPEDDPDPNTIRIAGRVLDVDCRPLANAFVELWQAGGDGEYDNISPDFKYRGTFVTDADGTYFFRTVWPGHYLNGSQFRPAHLHFRVTRAGYKSIITQLYFEGDEYIPEDEWASDPSAARRILPLEEVNAADHKYEVAFDFSLDIRTGTQTLAPAFADRIRYNNPFGTRLSDSVGGGGSVDSSCGIAGSAGEVSPEPLSHTGAGMCVQNGGIRRRIVLSAAEDLEGHRRVPRREGQLTRAAYTTLSAQQELAKA